MKKLTGKEYFFIGTMVLMLMAWFVLKIRYSEEREKANLSTYSLQKSPALKTGDIVFQECTDYEHSYIQDDSPYNHCGIIFKIGKNAMVFEISDKGKFVPLDTWADRTLHGVISIKRLHHSEQIFTTKQIANMLEYAQKFQYRKSDTTRNWNFNKRLYNAEFVWKMYHSKLAVKLCEPINGKITLAKNKVVGNKYIRVSDIYHSKLLDNVVY